MPYWKSTNKFFNMEQTNIKSLIATCHEKMIGDGYSESTIATHMSNLERVYSPTCQSEEKRSIIPTLETLFLKVLLETPNGKSTIVASAC